MQIDLQNLLHQLATFIAAQASIAYSTKPAQLFLHELVEADSTLVISSPSPAAVLTPYEGETAFVPVNTTSCQIKTIGVARQNASAMSFHQLLHGTLTDARGVPLRMKNLPISSPAFRINAILNLRGPKQIGRDDKGRAMIVSNFDAEFVPLT